jgi:hypothetical protein
MPGVERQAGGRHFVQEEVMVARLLFGRTGADGYIYL